MYKGRQYIHDDKKIFGVFADSCPDRWGQRLMKRREELRAKNAGEKPRKLLDSDYLLGVYDEARMGGLRFKTELEGEFLSNDREFATPPWTSLRELEQASIAFENDDFTFTSTATSRAFYAWMNFESPVTSDPAVRKAIAMGIDKDSFVSVLLNGYGYPAVGAFPDTFSFGGQNLTTESYDPDGAKKVLEEAGWVDSDGDGIREKELNAIRVMSGQMVSGVIIDISGKDTDLLMELNKFGLPFVVFGTTAGELAADSVEADDYNGAYQAAETCKKTFRAKIEEVVERPDGLFPAAGAYRRYPLSAYLKKKLKRIDALIVDELHQYSGESAQGQAMAELAGIADKVLGMTATLVNGYAQGIFYLLFRLKARLMLLDNQVYKRPRDFCLQYGVLEEMYEEDTTEYNSTSKSKKKRKVRERFLPGVSPIVYSRFLLENAVFLGLNDMGKELPDYEGIPIPCTMLPEVKKEYDTLQNRFRYLMSKEPGIGKRVMSAYLNLLSAYPDQPYGHEPIRNPFVEEEGMNVLSAPKDIGSADDLQPKDEVLLDLIDRKLQEGERVIVYTAWVRLDTQERLHKLLTEKGVKAAILDQKVPTVQREEWVDKRVREGVKVLITNSALVETGLDLNAFTTLVFYNIAFNLYVFRQASRRSWRINQTAPKVEIYMLYYADTMQHKALRLMASKLSAATVIEGQISDEGLAAMSDCQDLTTQLAKELMRGLKDDVEDLAASFKKMAIFGNHPKPAAAEKYSAPAEPEKQLLPVQQPILLPVPACSETKRAGAEDTGQVSIFDLLAS